MEKLYILNIVAEFQNRRCFPASSICARPIELNHQGSLCIRHNGMLPVIFLEKLYTVSGYNSMKNGGSALTPRDSYSVMEYSNGSS